MAKTDSAANRDESLVRDPGENPNVPNFATKLRELVDLTGVRGYTSWKDEERGCEAVSLETHEALVDDYMALGRAADDLLTELEGAS